MNVIGEFSTIQEKIKRIKTVINLILLAKNEKELANGKMDNLCRTANLILNSYHKLQENLNIQKNLNEELKKRNEFCEQCIHGFGSVSPENNNYQTVISLIVPQRRETELQSSPESNDYQSPSLIVPQRSREAELQFSSLIKQPVRQGQLVKQQPKCLVLDMEEITREELKSIPKYMCFSKLTLNYINEFVSHINQVLAKKYAKGKRVNNYNDSDLKRQQFLTEEELQIKGKGCLSKENEKILDILRYLKKLQTKRINNFGKLLRIFIIMK